MTAAAPNLPSPKGTRSIPWWAIALLVAVCVILWAHYTRYYRALHDAADDTVILQASLVSLDGPNKDRLLNEMNPLVIEDRLVDPSNDVPKTVLKWQFVWRSRDERWAESDPSSIYSEDREPANVARSRFTLIFFDGKENATASHVFIQKPRRKKADPDLPPPPVVAVTLEPGATLILPPLWRYATDNPTAIRVRLHDTMSLLIGGG